MIFQSSVFKINLFFLLSVFAISVHGMNPSQEGAKAAQIQAEIRRKEENLRRTCGANVNQLRWKVWKKPDGTEVLVPADDEKRPQGTNTARALVGMELFDVPPQEKFEKK